MKLNYSILLFTGWAGFLVIDILKKQIWRYGSEYFLLSYLPGSFLWIIFIILLYWLFQKFRLLKFYVRLVILLVTGIVAGALKSWINIQLFFILKKILSPSTPINPLVQRIRPGFIYIESIIIAWVILIVFLFLEYYKKYRQQELISAQLESELIKSQLESLKMQLQPHFIFNAHNSISTLIRNEKNKEAIDMIAGLSDLLRIALANEGKQLIPLDEEIMIAKKYLNIEKIRFEDTLSVSYSIADNTKKSLVPHFILQPLVENAFKHGINKTIGPCEISIGSSLINEKLMLYVYNTGPSIGDEWEMKNNKGIGLTNLLHRLNKLFPEGESEFYLKDEGQGTKAVIILPVQYMPDEV